MSKVKRAIDFQVKLYDYMAEEFDIPGACFQWYGSLIRRIVSGNLIGARGISLEAEYLDPIGYCAIACSATEECDVDELILRALWRAHVWPHEWLRDNLLAEFEFECPEYGAIASGDLSLDMLERYKDSKYILYLRYCVAKEHPELLQIEWIQESILANWLIARFLHIINLHRADLAERAMQIIAQRPSLALHLLEIDRGRYTRQTKNDGAERRTEPARSGGENPRAGSDPGLQGRSDDGNSDASGEQEEALAPAEGDEGTSATAE